MFFHARLRYVAASAAITLSLLSGCTKWNEKPDGEFTNFGTGTGSGTGTGTGTGGSSWSVSLDPTWGNAGRTVTPLGNLKDFARAIAQQPNGKIIVGGKTQVVAAGNVHRYDIGLVRYDARGNIDRLFGTASGVPGEGIVRVPAGSGNVEFADMTVNSSGEIYVAASTTNGTNNDFALVKLRENGTVDTSYGSGGAIITDIVAGENDIAKAMARDASGRLIVVGSTRRSDGSRFAMVRYPASGVINDTTFGTGVTSTLQEAWSGRVLTRFNLGRNQGANAVAIQPDGKIVVAGWVQVPSSRTNDFAIARYSADGVLDTTFKGELQVGTGVVTTDFGFGRDDVATAIAVSNDKILVGGHSVRDGVVDFALARYNADGTLDTTFGNGGRVTTRFTIDSYVTALKVQSDGSIMATGYAATKVIYHFAAARYFSSGTLDSSFGSSGKMLVSFGSGQNSFGRASLVASDGALFVAGETYPGATQFDFAVAKLK